MKSIKKTLSIVLILSIVMCMGVFQANAAIPPRKMGDVNGDNFVDITDATAIQKHIAEIESIYESFYGYSEAADVDDDAKITVLDATIIQQYIAEIITEFPAGEEYFVDKYFYDLHTDYNSGKAMTGMPVTFYVHGYCSPAPTTVKLYINEELVAQTQEATDLYDYKLSYTFKEAGTYQIRVFMCDKWGYGINRDIKDYIVVDVPQDTSHPVITGVYRNNSCHNEPEITAISQFGTAPYQYKFTLTIYGGREVVKTQDFSENNKFQVDFLDRFPAPGYYTVTVDVIDALGNAVSETYDFVTDEIIPA